MTFTIFVVPNRLDVRLIGVMTYRTPSQRDDSRSMWPALFERAAVVSAAATVTAVAMLALRVPESVIAVSLAIACSILGWAMSAPHNGATRTPRNPRGGHRTPALRHAYVPARRTR